MGRDRDRRGMMLIASAGILMGLALLGVLIVQVAVLWSAGVRARAQGVVARLSASSGLEYAVARLWQETDRPDASALVPATAADDWSARETVADAAGPLARSRNPSWARGDRWTDVDADGKFSAAVDALAAELDDNGSVDAATGRLRGRGTMGLGFSARVRAATGLVCVNSGELGSLTGDQDLDGILNGQDPDYDTNIDGGAEDWQDPDFIGNVHIVNLLGNLGAIAEVSTTRTDQYHPGVPSTDAVNAIEFVTSDLGRQIVSARPRGGYLSLWQVEQAIGSDDFAKVAEHLSTLGDIVPVSFPDVAKQDLLWNAASAPESRHEFHARIDLNNASLDVLKASLRYLSASGTWRVGSPATTAVVETPFVRLQKDEADAIAERIASARPIYTWKQLLKVLSPSADVPIPDDGSVFMDDPFCPATAAIQGVARRRLKEDLILAQADANGYWMDPASWHRNTLEIEREGALFQGFDETRIRVITKGALAGDLVSAPYGSDGVATTTIANHVTGIPSRQTTEWSLAGSVPGAFVVACEGWARRTGGMPASAARGAAEIRVTGSFVLAGQQDFERLPRTLADPSATSDRWDSPGGEIWTDGCAQARSGVQSAPRFPFMTGAVNPETGIPDLNILPDPDRWPASEYRYPAAIGDLRLSTYQLSPEERGAGASLGTGAPLYALTFGENWTEYGQSEDTGWLDNIGDSIARGAFAPNSLPGTEPFRCDALQSLPVGGEAFFQGFLFGSGGGMTTASGPSSDARGGGGGGALALLAAAAPSTPRIVRTEWISAASVPFAMGPDDNGGAPIDGLQSGDVRIAGLAMEGVQAGGGIQPAPVEPTPGDGNFWAICAGTIEVTIPTTGGDGIVPSVGQISIQYRSGTSAAGNPTYTPFGTFFFRNDGRVGVKTTIVFVNTLTGVTAINLNPPQIPFPVSGDPLVHTAGSGCHHVALALRKHPTEANASMVRIYIDGIEVGDTPLRFHPNLPPLGGIVIDAQWPFDDLLVYPETLDQPTIERHAQRARFATDTPENATGAFRSAWFNVDPERFPDGVRVRAMTFDTYIPSKTGGRFAFEVVTDSDSDSATWDWDAWKTGATAPRAKLSLDRARSVQLRVSASAHDDDPTGTNRWTDIWPRVGGKATLRDTPVLDEVVIHYADKPRWTDCRLR